MSFKYILPAAAVLISGIAVDNIMAVSPGITGGAVLRKISNARALAMGESIGAFEGDLSGVHINPAVLSTLKKPQASSTFLRGFAGDSLSLVSFGVPSRYGGFYGSFNYYGAGDAELLFSDGRTQTVTAQRDNVFSFGYAKDLSRNAGLGVSVNYMTSCLAQEAEAEAFSVNAGFLLRNIPRK